MDGFRNKKASVLKFSFLGGAFFLFLKMSMADRFTCLCSARSFRGDASETSEKHAPNNHLSNVKKCRCLHLTTVNRHAKNGEEKKRDESAHEHTKKCGFSTQLLSVDPNCSSR